MTTVEAASTAGRTVATIRHWCRAGVIKAVKAAGRWVIDAASLARRIRLAAKEQPMEPSLTKTLTDGRTATVTRNGRDWDVTIDGEPYAIGGRLHMMPVKGNAMWVIKANGSVLGLTDDEYTVLKAVLDAESAILRATPKAKRFELVATAELAANDLTRASETASNRGEPDWSERTRLEAEFNDAVAALEAFDAAHPELTAERETQRQKDIAEALNRAHTD